MDEPKKNAPEMQILIASLEAQITHLQKQSSILYNITTSLLPEESVDGNLKSDEGEPKNYVGSLKALNSKLSDLVDFNDYIINRLQQVL